MCDTFVALPEATATGGVLLAKNADTEINEAQHVFKMPRRQFAEGAQVRVTHMLIPQVRETYEYVIDKSFWLYGGEIGLNEHGVAVGNEAVFSTRPSDKDGVILIDLLRLILERAQNRHEAVDLVASLLDRFGQGGNCELRGNSHFDGSFIVSDRDGAVVIETAGKDWAAREVTGLGSISNGYTIGSDWDRSSLPGSNGSRPHFGDLVEDKEKTRCVGARERQAMSHDFLDARRGRIDVRAMADLLRYTGEGDYDPMQGETPVRICMHAAPYTHRLWQATGRADRRCPRRGRHGLGDRDLGAGRLDLQAGLLRRRPSRSRADADGELHARFLLVAARIPASPGHGRLPQPRPRDQGRLRGAGGRFLRGLRDRAEGGAGREGGVRARLLAAGGRGQRRLGGKTRAPELLRGRFGLSGNVEDVQ